MVPPVLFLVLPAAVRHLLTGTAPVGCGSRTHSTHILRHLPGKAKNFGVQKCGLKSLGFGKLSGEGAVHRQEHTTKHFVCVKIRYIKKYFIVKSNK